jgi:putative transposase
MLAGVATRRHVDVTEPVGVDGRATSKSAASRRFKAATEVAMGELLARDLSEVETAVLMIDGLNVADQMIVVALIITADGTKVPAGLMLGDTENHIVVTDLLADLVARDAIDRRLAQAFAEPDPAKGLTACRNLAKQLDGAHPEAAASLRTGLEEMFTVARLGVTGRLRQSLTNTNCVESMISLTRTTTGRVKHWRDGTMTKRWIAAGMLEAERSFRRLKGFADMPSSSRPSRKPPHPTLSHQPTTLRLPEQVRDHHRTSTRSGTSSGSMEVGLRPVCASDLPRGW